MQKIIFALIFITLASGCQFPPRIYRFDVHQGTEISREDFNKVKVGMTKTQVQEILGTPSTDLLFNSNKWDYHYSFKSGKDNEFEKKHFVVIFKDELVEKTIIK